MQKTLESVLPTTLSRMSLGLLVLAVPFAFVLPDYLPNEIWDIKTLSKLLMRLLLAVSVMPLCMMVALVSILQDHKKINKELSEAKKLIPWKERNSFAEKLDSELERNGL